MQPAYMAPRFWTASKRFTTTLCLRNCRTPWTRLAVTIMGSICGVSATATDSPKVTAPCQLPAYVGDVGNSYPRQKNFTKFPTAHVYAAEGMEQEH